MSVTFRPTRQRPRSLDPHYDSWMPSITEGLLCHAPFRFNRELLYSADGQTGLESETVSDKGMRYNWKTGLLEQAVTNEASIEPNGVRVENTRTNLILRSQELDVDGAGTPWLHNAVSVTADQIAAPDGTLTADKIAETTDNDFHYITQAVAITVARYTFSGYFKNGNGRDWIVLAGEGEAQAAAWFDIANGVVGTVSGTQSPTARIESLPGGWYRCQLSWTGTAAAAKFMISGIVQTDGSAAGYVGDPTKYHHASGLQCELGGAASSLIPNAGATTQRPKDKIRLDNTGEVHLSYLAGTVGVGYTPDYTTPSSERVWTCRSGANWVDCTLATNYRLYTSGVGGGVNSGVAPVAGVTNVIIVSWDAAGNIAIEVDGTRATASGAAIGGALTTIIEIGGLNDSLKADGTIAHFVGYNRAFVTGEMGVLRRDIKRWMRL